MLAFAALSAAIIWSSCHGRPSVHGPKEAENVEVDTVDESAPEPITSVPRLPATPTLPLGQGVPASALAALPDFQDTETRDVVAANRRARIADEWGLTEAQAVAFDAASEAPSAERMDVMLRFARGEIDQRDLSAEMQAADQRGLQVVREVLGEERFDDYLSMRARLEGDEPDMSPVPYSDL